MIDVSILLECWGKWAIILMFGFIVYQLNKIVSSEKKRTEVQCGGTQLESQNSSEGQENSESLKLNLALW